MKKLLAVALLICMMLSLCACGQKNEPEKTAETAAPEETSAVENAEETLKTIDFDAIYALHSPGEVVMTVDGNDVTWAEFFYPYYYSAASMESFMQYYAMNGQVVEWDQDIGDGSTFAGAVLPNTEYTLKTYAAIEGVAKNNKIELGEESKEMMEELHKKDLERIGEGTTEEDFAKVLAGMYMTEEVYEKMNMRSLLYNKIVEDVYGKNGEKISEEDVQKWVEENGYLGANHILFSVDDSMDDAKKAEIESKCKELSDELRGIKTDADRLERFLELKTELDEDPGKEYYPNGYIFQDGDMVEEFSAAAKLLKAYEVSEPVKTEYGYHLIMGIPVESSSLLTVQSDGSEATVGSTIADEKASAELQEYFDKIQIKYADGFKVPSVTDYLV